MRSIIRTLSGIRTDERGTSLVEFAFAAPIFALLVVGVGDLARGFSEKYALQQAVDRTVELAHLGSSEDDYEYLKTEAAAAAAAVGSANPVVSLDQWLECNGNKDARKAWTETCPEGEQIARYVKLTIDASYRPSFGTAGYPGAVNGNVPITASTSLRVQ